MHPIFLTASQHPSAGTPYSILKRKKLKVLIIQETETLGADVTSAAHVFFENGLEQSCPVNFCRIAYLENLNSLL
jgi:hypothetical protein